MDLRALTISFHSDDKILKKDEEKKNLKSKQMKNMKSKFYKFSFIENSCQKGFLKTKGNDNPAYTLTQQIYNYMYTHGLSMIYVRTNVSRSVDL